MAKGKKHLVACLYDLTKPALSSERLCLFETSMLGRPAIQFSLDAILELKPEIVFLILSTKEKAGEFLSRLASQGKTQIYFFEVKGRNFLRFKNQEALAAARVTASFLDRYPDCDILVAPARGVLLRPETCAGLVRAHLQSGNALTFLRQPQEADLSRVLIVRRKELSLIEKTMASLKTTDNQSVMNFRLTRTGQKIGSYEKFSPEQVLELVASHDFNVINKILRGRKTESLISSGVRIIDPASVWLDWDVSIGERTVINPFVVITGSSVIGPECAILPFTSIRNSRLGKLVRILGFSDIDDSRLEDQVQVGPFSRLRPGTIIRKGAKVGNFVEMKKTDFGSRSKAQHLSYVGDSIVGEDVNIGAGTITCNYDGFSKHQTVIESGVFIGSGTELIAPVKIGRKAYVAAGSTINKDVKPETLAIARARQVEKPASVLEKLKEKSLKKKK